MDGPPDPTSIAAGLLARYCHLVDRGPWTAIADLFTEDCVVEVPGHPLRGRAALHAFYEERSLTDLTSRHLISNVVADLVGPGRIASIATLTLHRERGGVTPVLIADSLDTIVRTDGGWRFAEKRIVPVFHAQQARPLPKVTP